MKTLKCGRWKVEFKDAIEQVAVHYEFKSSPHMITYKLIEEEISHYGYFYITIAENSDKLYFVKKDDEIRISQLQPFDRNQVVWSGDLNRPMVEILTPKQVREFAKFGELS